MPKEKQLSKENPNWKLLVLALHKSLIVNDIDNVNDGGCGYFAFFVANELERYGIKYKIKVTDKIKLGGRPIKKKVESVNRYIDKKIPPNKALVSITHCWIEVLDKGIIYKFDGETSNLYPDWDYESDADYSGYMTKKELKVVLKYAQWNKLYKKNSNCKLRSIIRETFKNHM